MRLWILSVLLCGLLSACATTSISGYPEEVPAPNPRVAHKIVVVLDGTGNDLATQTNAARLYELVANQNRRNISIFYTEGVGSDGRVIGMLTGWGIGKDVRDAYRFIAENWTPGSQIYIVGFSRGAYAGRVLSGLIYTAGIVRPRSGTPPELPKGIVDRLYDAYKMMPGKGETPTGRETRRSKRVASVLAANDLVSTPTTIRAAAYWDTVEALGAPDRTDDPFNEGGPAYLDQLCNVERAFHAVALDDNRVLSYTPILMTGDKMIELCPDRNLDSVVDEVWFSGAHADLGGTYQSRSRIQGYLAGVSLNWMIANLQSEGILPQGAGQFGNPLDMIHDAERANLLYRGAFYRKSRSVLEWAGRTLYNGGRPKLHDSVVKRLGSQYAIDAAFAAHCVRAHPLAPRLLCSAQLRDMMFLQSMKTRDCLTEDPLPAPTDANGQPIGGYRLVGMRDRRPGETVVETRCATVVYDK